MPWRASDAKRHKADLSPTQARAWAHIANRVLADCLKKGGKQSACEGRAIRIANTAVERVGKATTNSLLTLRTNLVADPSRIVLNGQEHVVAPVVLIVAGVLNYGLIPGEELDAERWQGVAVTVGHPQDFAGIPHSARQPHVLAACGIGQVFNVEQSLGMRTGQQVASLRGELWLNLAAIERCGEDAKLALKMLEHDRRLEVSTAFYSRAEEASGVFCGDPYVEIHRHLRPDHLALLPHDIGACSWENGGCGAPRLNHSTLTYEHICQCADPTACACQEDMPMIETPPLSHLQRFWHLIHDFMQREAPVTQDAETDDAAAPDPEETPSEEPEDKDAHVSDDEEAEVAYAMPASDPDMNEKESSMPVTNVIKRRVDALIENPRTHWTEGDRHMLEEQNEAFLIRLEHQPLAPPPVANSSPEEPQTLEDALQRIPAHLRETMQAATDAYTKRKGQLIEVLLANKQNPFAREDLEAMHADRLEKLVTMSGEPLPGQPVTAAPNYNGRRMPHLRIVTPEGEDDGRPPALPSTMELVVEEQKKRGIRF